MPNILIVDDDPHILKELPKIFSKFYKNHIVHTAHSFKKADDYLQDNTYEIVMLDGMLSERITDPPEHAFGKFLIPRILATSQKANIIAMSSTDDLNEEAFILGAGTIISKEKFFKSGKVVNCLNTSLVIQEL